MHSTYNINTSLSFKKCITNDPSQVAGFEIFVFIFNDYSEWRKKLWHCSRQYTIPLTFKRWLTTSHIKLHYGLFLQHYVKPVELCLFHKRPQLTPIIILI